MNNPAKPCILIVEDSIDIQDSLKQLFESEKYQVEVASNGQEALDYLHAHPAPHIILLDLMMPVMDGYEFRRAQDADPKLIEIPVVIMTADGHIEEKAPGLGARAFLKKPVDIDVILETIQKHRRK
jgi:CheY-like chemotaxis protein